MKNCARCSAYLIYSILPVIYEVDIHNISISQMKKLRHRGQVCVAQPWVPAQDFWKDTSNSDNCAEGGLKVRNTKWVKTSWETTFYFPHRYSWSAVQ